MKFSSSIKIVWSFICLMFFSTFALANNFSFINPDEMAKVMEKIPPMVLSLKSPNLTEWACVNVNLKEHCGDLDGCKVTLNMTHKIDGTDKTLGIQEFLYFENRVNSTKKGNGKYGYTRQAGGGQHFWITGNTTRYTMYAPWAWSYMYNYRHAYCPDQTGHGPAFKAPYKVSLMNHPHVNIVVIIED